jgi:hypothetical protein
VWRVWRQQNQLIVLLLSTTTLFQLLLMVNVAGAGEISCHSIRYTYYNKGLDVADVPKSPQQGTDNIHNRILILIQNRAQVATTM